MKITHSSHVGDDWQSARESTPPDYQIVRCRGEDRPDLGEWLGVYVLVRFHVFVGARQPLAMCRERVPTHWRWHRPEAQ